jgi:hypothetical protein
MQKPTLWLDIVVYCIAAFGLILAILCSREDPSPHKGKLKRWSSYCFAAVCIFASCDTLLTRRIAERASWTGTIGWMEQHRGKNDHSSFALIDASGNRASLRIDYAGEMLQLGEKVKVVWMSYNDQAIRLDVLSGPLAGRFFDDTTPFGSIMDFLLGFAILGIATFASRKNPNAYPRDRSNDPPPLTGVDSQSLIKLN